LGFLSAPPGRYNLFVNRADSYVDDREIRNPGDEDHADASSIVPRGDKRLQRHNATNTVALSAC
jgi:hypothetical protein